MNMIMTKYILSAILAAIFVWLLLPGFCMHLYYFIMVVGMMCMGFSTRDPWYYTITMILFFGYVAENNPEAWFNNQLILCVVHLVIVWGLLRWCSTRGSNAHIYLAILSGLKALNDVGFATGLTFDVRLYYQLTLNLLAIMQMIGFMHYCILRTALIKDHPDRVDPLTLRFVAWMKKRQIRLY